MNIKKTRQVLVFAFIVLNFVEKAVLHFFLLILDHVKIAKSNKQEMTSNAEHFKEKSCIQSYHYRHVTRGVEGEGLPYPFSKIGKKCPDFGKNYPDCGHL